MLAKSTCISPAVQGFPFPASSLLMVALTRIYFVIVPLNLKRVCMYMCVCILILASNVRTQSTHWLAFKGFPPYFLNNNLYSSFPSQGITSIQQKMLSLQGFCRDPNLYPNCGPVLCKHSQRWSLLAMGLPSLDCTDSLSVQTPSLTVHDIDPLILPSDIRSGQSTFLPSWSTSLCVHTHSATAAIC